MQDGEAGGITQQIGATNVPKAAIVEQTKMCKEVRLAQLLSVLHIRVTMIKKSCTIFDNFNFVFEYMVVGLYLVNLEKSVGCRRFVCRRRGGVQEIGRRKHSVVKDLLCVCFYSLQSKS